MSELTNEIMEEELNVEPVLAPIENDQEANECLEAIRKAQADKAYWKEWYEERLNLVNESNDAIILQNETRLYNYFGTVPHKKTATQENYALPAGKLVLKKQAPEFERDDEAVIAWLKANGGEKYVKVKESLDWAGLKGSLMVMGDSVADEKGNVIPCITVTERPDVFKAELKKEGK